MEKDFIFVVLKLALHRGNYVEISTRNGREKTKIIDYQKNILTVLNTELKIEKNDNIIIEIFYNGIFKLNGNVSSYNEDYLKIKLLNDFQYVTKRRNFRIPSFLPVRINETDRGILVDFNKNNSIGLVIFSNLYKKGDKINIKILNTDEVLADCVVIAKRDEIFNLERLIVNIPEKENYVTEKFNKIFDAYL